MNPVCPKNHPGAVLDLAKKIAIAMDCHIVPLTDGTLPQPREDGMGNATVEMKRAALLACLATLNEQSEEQHAAIRSRVMDALKRGARFSSQW